MKNKKPKNKNKCELKTKGVCQKGTCTVCGKGYETKENYAKIVIIANENKFEEAQDMAQEKAKNRDAEEE